MQEISKAIVAGCLAKIQESEDAAKKRQFEEAELSGSDGYSNRASRRRHESLQRRGKEPCK
ncbi:MAG: hypothetical protein ACREPT_05645 [Rudaea sp.]